MYHKVKGTEVTLPGLNVKPLFFFFEKNRGYRVLVRGGFRTYEALRREPRTSRLHSGQKFFLFFVVGFLLGSFPFDLRGVDWNEEQV